MAKFGLKQSSRTVVNCLPKMTLKQCAKEANVLLNTISADATAVHVFRVDYCYFLDDQENSRENLSLEPGEKVTLPQFVADEFIRAKGDEGIVAYDLNDNPEIQKKNEVEARYAGLMRALQHFERRGSIPLAKVTASLNDPEKTVYRQMHTGYHNNNVKSSLIKTENQR